MSANASIRFDMSRAELSQRNGRCAFEVLLTVHDLHAHAAYHGGLYACRTRAEGRA